MALDATYSGLQASIADWLNRTDLTAVIPDFITLAETQINRKLLSDGPVRLMMGRSDATISAEFSAVPTDFLGTRAFKLTGTITRSLIYAEPENINDLKQQYVSSGGDPTHFSVVGGEFQFWPWAGTGTYPAELTYWKRIPALSASNTTNWLIISHPDAYLYGALVQSAPYLKDDQRVQTWGTLFQQAMADIVTASKMESSAPHLAIPTPSNLAP